MEHTGVSVSHDIYHDNQGCFSPTQFFSFYRNYKDNNDYNGGLCLVDEGRAHEYGLSINKTYSHRINKSIEVIDFDESLISLDTLYVNAKGEILADCDLNYEHQDEYSLGNLRSVIKTEIERNNGNDTF